MSKIRIVGAVASKSGITLYLADGEQIELQKNSHRTNEIMKAIAKPLAKKKIVDLDLAEYSAHAMIEKKTGGLIRFVKEKVSNFLGLDVISGGSLGVVPVKSDETIVAVVAGKKIPGMAALDRQIEHAAFTKDCKGFTLFMERLASVIDERGHSVQELLNFMQRADLPIADDGTIVAYKTLCWGDRDKGVFVDKHTRKIKQRVGSRVSMPLAMVDASRRTECSTGLHIARRRYLTGYYGDLLTLVKIAPEDVIAVPHGEPDKMRAMAYHIVFLLPDEIANLVRKDQPMTEHHLGAKILADIIAGDHVGVLEEVKIGDFKSTESGREKEVEVVDIADTVQPFLGAGDNGLAAALDDSKGVELDIRGLNKQIEDALAEGVETAPKKRRAEARKAKPVDPTPKPEKAPSDAQRRREEAFKAVVGGMSQREAAKQFNVCAKTLRKMVRERTEAPKAAE